MSLLIQNYDEMSLACFTSPTLKWWPSPLPSATVPSEVRLIDSSPLLLRSHVPSVTHLSIVHLPTVSPPHLYSPWTHSHSLSHFPLCKVAISGPPCGLAFSVRVSGCFVEAENKYLFIPLRKRNVNMSVSFVIFQERSSTPRSIFLYPFMCSACEAYYTENCSMLAVDIHSLTSTVPVIKTVRLS